MKFLFFTLIFFTLSGQVSADTSDESSMRANWLRKTYFLLTGHDAQRSEYDLAIRQNMQDWTSYQKLALKNIFNSDDYAKKLTTEIVEHLGLPANGSSFEKNRQYAVSELIQPILRGQAPWTSLYNSRDVYINLRSPREVTFYKRIFGNSLPVPDYTFQAANESSEMLYTRVSAQNQNQANALAGFFTTTDFFDRYYTTNTNENRKRAAALYRLLLCDDMKPVILSDAALEKSLLMAAMTDIMGGGTSANAGAPPPTTAEQHASNPECQTCHRKLEPAARLFITSPKSPTGTSLPSQFVFGQQNQSVIGLGQWVDAALSTDSAKICQVRFFWNFVIGKNVPISETQMISLLKLYASSKENVQELLTELMTKPEFSMKAEELEARPVTISDVRPLLQRCDSCHAAEGTIPDFTRLPFARTAARHNRWLQKIADETDLENHGAKATMPPAKAGWKPSAMEYRMLSKWLSDGARDEKNEPSTTEKILNGKPNLGLDEATFLPTFRRYLRTREILNYAKSTAGCLPFRLDNQLAISEIDSGATSFTKIAPVLEVPGPGYFTYVSRCITPELSKNFILENRLNGSRRILLNGQEDLALAEKVFDYVFVSYRFTTAERIALISRAMSAVKTKRLSEDSTENFVKEMTLGLTSLPEFLTY